MPAKAFPTLLIFTLVLLATPTIFAQAGAANGKYKFVMDDGLIKYLEFDVINDSKGGTNGYMVLTDEAQVPLEEPNGDEGGRKGGESLAFSMKADIDGMTIEKNKAVITGMVRESSISRYLGKWIRLVIEDNDGIEIPDKFGWSFCQQEEGGWIPSDAEVPGDRGAFMHWWATDAERKDDVGVPSADIVPGNLKGCRPFPILAYDFAEFVKGDGAISIKQ